mgnify:FL=1
MKDYIESFGRDIPEKYMDLLLDMSEHKIARYVKRFPMKVATVKKVVPKKIPKVVEKIDEEE